MLADGVGVSVVAMADVAIWFGVAYAMLITGQRLQPPLHCLVPGSWRLVHAPHKGIVAWE